MMHMQVTRSGNDPLGEIQEFKLSITQESIPQFKELVNRALNCWDRAPKDLKDLGDMLTHGRITQNHTL
jgi:hypothetical protein